MRGKQEVVKMKRILLAILVLSAASICYAADEGEEITLTTYYPAPYGDYDELSVSGNAYLAVDSGNVGIGTTNPGAKLHIKDGGIFITGTTSPEHRLHILTEADPAYGSYLLHEIYRDDTSAGGMIVQHARGSKSVPAIVNQGDTTLLIEGWGHDGTRFIMNAAIKMLVDGPPGQNNMPGRIDFWTTPSGDDIAQLRMVINNDGNVGIGTASPGAKLHIGGTAGTDGIMFPDGTLQKTAAGTGGGSTPASGTVVGGGYVEWTTFGENTNIMGCGGMWGQVEQNASKTLSVKPGVNASLQMTGSYNFKVGVTQRRRDYYLAIQN